MLLAVFGKLVLLTLNMLDCSYLLAVLVEVKKKPFIAVFRPSPITVLSSFLLGMLQDSKVL